MDLIVVKNYGDRIQAHYLAVAGIEKAKAALYHEARSRSRSAQHHSGELYDAPDQFRKINLGRGEYSVFRRASDEEGGGLRYGISDEESRLNVNAASVEDLMKLDGMTTDVAAAMVDWRDRDKQVTPGGAEIEYYASLRPPRQPRDGPLQTVRELLMVRGFPMQYLPSGNAGQGGAAAEGGMDPESSTLGSVDLGWSGLLTVDSGVSDINAAGNKRVNVQREDERSLSSVRGITSDIAHAIVTYRGQHELQSIGDLLDVTAPAAQNALGPQVNNSGSRRSRSGDNSNTQSSDASSSSSTGRKVIDNQLLMDIADEVTVGTQNLLTGVVNINTAGVEVLACLPGMTRDLAQAIVTFRKSNGYFPNTAHLLKVPGMSPEIFRQVIPRVSVRSETFRILSEGRVPASGTRQRIQEIVRVSLDGLTTLSYREDDL